MPRILLYYLRGLPFSTDGVISRLGNLLVDVTSGTDMSNLNDDETNIMTSAFSFIWPKNDLLGLNGLPFSS